jgi:hypothetical protein
MERRELLKLVMLPGPPALASETATTYACRFHARAAVQLLSVTVFTRANVGSGYLRVTGRDAPGRRYLRFEFGAGSLPERAGGLNRLGVIEETVVESPEGVASASYFGFMTASNEKNLDQARTALKSKAGNIFDAIRGRIERGRVVNQSIKVTGCADATWADRDKLKPVMLERLTAETAATEAPAGTCGTFLHAVYRALQTSDPATRRQFIHNGKPHWLDTVRRATAGASKEGELAGRVSSASGEELSRFRLWFDAARQPVRFEFRPRSFLRLTFERV